MADQPMRSLYRHIRADEPEVARYRRHLATRLDQPGWQLLRRPLVLVTGTAALSVVAVVALLIPRPTPPAALPQLQLAELQALIATPSADIVTRAQALATQGQPQDRCNALMLLCLTEPDERAVHYAAQGIEQDPRPEFRFFYLELLLDRADEYQLNPRWIEELMDRESDRGCLRLYRRLLYLAT